MLSAIEHFGAVGPSPHNGGLVFAASEEKHQRFFQTYSSQPPKRIEQIRGERQLCFALNSTSDVASNCSSQCERLHNYTGVKLMDSVATRAPFAEPGVNFKHLSQTQIDTEGPTKSHNEFILPYSRSKSYNYAAEQSDPINLVTSNGTCYNTSAHFTVDGNRSPSSSSSVDVENDGSTSPNSQSAVDGDSYVKNEPTCRDTTACLRAYSFNYEHLYPNGRSLFRPPLVYPTCFSAEYLKAIHSASVIFNPMTPTVPQFMPSPNHSTKTCKSLADSNSTPELPSVLNGTYLNEKANVSTASCDKKFFKIPNGKDTLKTRIQSRSISSEKTETLNTPTVMRTHNSTSNFKKGSYIELSNGLLRRVEDMRTEDFIQCADRSILHQLTESTVVKITMSTSNTATIAFSYDRNQSKVDIKVLEDHPFFVYGQGWASCNPEESLKAYGLKCQRLQVGDICISLSQRLPQDDLNDMKREQGSLCDQNKTAENTYLQNRVRDVQSFAEDSKPTVPPAINAFNTPILPGATMHKVPTHFMGTKFNIEGQSKLREHPPSCSLNYYTQLPAKHQQQNIFYAPPLTNIQKGLLEREIEHPSLARKRRWSAPESCNNDDVDTKNLKKVPTPTLPLSR